jgi:hypothetical protein
MTYAIHPSPAMTAADYHQQSNQQVYEILKPNPDAGISMNVAGGDEMLRVTKNGFYVRGVLIEQDDKEAEIVYNAFKQWLAWANLQQGR